jgi:VanZ family protein
MLLINDLRNQNKSESLKNKSILFSLIFGIIFGLFTEMIQLYEQLHRNSNIYDFIADVSGCILGIPLYLLVYTKK